ncbi:MAG: HAD hydrolase-like protein [Bacteroidaceae bacterium]|nr:HAD hydrolase-like protein [Bacteroidaceae bacterium]
MFKQNITKYLEKHGFEAFMPKAVLFDMDGVIYDSMPAHAYAWNKATKEFGLRFTEEDTFAHEGMRGEEVISNCMREQKGREATPEEIKTIYGRKAEIIMTEFGDLPMMPGTKELMQKLKDAGLLIIVVTGSGQPSTLSKVVTDYEGLVSRELIISSKDCTKGKPDPQPYLMGLERAGKALGRTDSEGNPAPLNPWEAIVVENAPMGVQSGTGAKILTIGVNTGPLPDKMLWDAGADIVIKPMTALRDSISYLIGTI